MSVNQTLNFSRAAKQEEQKFKAAIATKIREERVEEKECAAMLLVDTEKAKRQILDLRMSPRKWNSSRRFMSITKVN